MKKILFFLFLVIPLELAVTQENDWPASSYVDILKDMKGTTDEIYLDYFKYRIEKTWKIVDEREKESGLYFRYSSGFTYNYRDFQNYLNWEATRNPVKQAIDRAVAEAEHRGENTFKAASDAIDDSRNKLEKAVIDFYKSLRKRHIDFPNLGSYRNDDLFFIDAIRPVIESAKDPQFIKDRLEDARIYSNLLGVGLDTAFVNLDKYKAEENERKIKREQMKAEEKRNKMLIGFGITIGILILIVLIYKLGKKRTEIEKPDIPEINLVSLPKKENEPVVTKNTLPENKNHVVNTDELLQLNKLLKEGAITQEEYDKIKIKYLEKYN